ncbi:tyrosine-type recombinase/integrase [Nodularia spumigena]|uniref:tyrosine-type recombinase/integrase n=1 Tax=Nodularia spumigena TaxID=70799 RepID=UPI002B20B983|nr:tyrosine-type recombinase/integrase [Nodularia spumigena]MEA5613054.1 tyrosine-type recombinase/integrase [Nodularia spumigena UHCC 0040]
MPSHLQSIWFLLRWVEKRKHWRFVQIHPLVAELVQEQQKFLDAQFGRDSEFDKLFCNVYTHHQSIPWADRELDTTLFYKPQTITRLRISTWLTNFREVADLKDKYGNRFKLTSHMFRRTKASIMAHCEVEDEYIAAVLGHGSLDMLPHYRQRSLIRLEKEANLKGYVDMYGRVTSFKPRKTRYEKLANLLKVSTPLGQCHRPTMLGDCQHRYACLSCSHHRVTSEDKSRLEADLNCLQQDLIQAQKHGQERRVTEITNLLALIKNRFDGLSELQNLQDQKTNG